VFHASFYPCTVSGACHGPEPWGVSWITAMFMHGSSAVRGERRVFEAKANCGGVAFFAHVGGFVFGALTTKLLAGWGRVGLSADGGALRAPA
jgi:membrane associated rhomboid family serine protease